MSMTRTVLAMLAMAISTSALAQSIAITGATLAIGDGSEPIRNGTVVITAGKVVAAGAGVAVPAGTKTIDAGGKWVTPGIVSGFSRVGLAEVPGVKETNDTRAARSPFSAAIDVAPAINPLANPIAISRTAGVTRAVVVPAAGNGIFAGQGAVIDLGADMTPITKARAFQFVEMGEEGKDDAGGSRAATVLTFRMMLREAQEFAKAPASYDGRSRDALLNRVDAEALVPVVTGAMPLMVHVESARDILTVLSLRQDFPALKLILAGATEGWMVAPQIVAAKVPVITAGLEDLPSSFEKLAATQSNVGRMVKAGVSVSMGLLTGDDALQLRAATQQAGNMVALTKVPGATGLSWGQALRTITSAPAEAMGLGDRFGSLKAGKAGDVVIWDGDPLEMTSAPVSVWIDGVQQPLENRQTKLRDRYASPSEGAMPKAYEW
ncbi:amidohydrolase family protein [Sphingobium limneticum]|jgi:imidazolonepropionase-like amidohydrolase|uniref:Amidohydrolase family protein n=1 Tax=Sphingobium limneticum TaxID=1007511 RepID=A0A5J5I2W9_9SPHN|nr:amidohydrolase family protein [Sphingobium limneticum]KAA9015823.1 amidohydrolase family protein [Sphingobium limneticum]KAA9028236.1 amidohydrolase family protein [Sphingobium limneticum]